MPIRFLKEIIEEMDKKEKFFLPSYGVDGRAYEEWLMEERKLYLWEDTDFEQSINAFSNQTTMNTTITLPKPCIQNQSMFKECGKFFIQNVMISNYDLFPNINPSFVMREERIGNIEEDTSFLPDDRRKVAA